MNLAVVEAEAAVEGVVEVAVIEVVVEVVIEEGVDEEVSDKRALNPEYSTVKPFLSGHSKIEKTKILKTNGSRGQNYFNIALVL